MTWRYSSSRAPPISCRLMSLSMPHDIFTHFHAILYDYIAFSKRLFCMCYCRHVEPLFSFSLPPTWRTYFDLILLTHITTPISSSQDDDAFIDAAAAAAFTTLHLCRPRVLPPRHHATRRWSRHYATDDCLAFEIFSASRQLPPIHFDIFSPPPSRLSSHAEFYSQIVFSERDADTPLPCWIATTLFCFSIRRRLFSHAALKRVWYWAFARCRFHYDWHATPRWRWILFFFIIDTLHRMLFRHDFLAQRWLFAIWPHYAWALPPLPLLPPLRETARYFAEMQKCLPPLFSDTPPPHALRQPPILFTLMTLITKLIKQRWEDACRRRYFLVARYARLIHYDTTSFSKLIFRFAAKSHASFSALLLLPFLRWHAFSWYYNINTPRED